MFYGVGPLMTIEHIKASIMYEPAAELLQKAQSQNGMCTRVPIGRESVWTSGGAA